MKNKESWLVHTTADSQYGQSIIKVVTASSSIIDAIASVKKEIVKAGYSNPQITECKLYNQEIYPELSEHYLFRNALEKLKDISKPQIYEFFFDDEFIVPDNKYWIIYGEIEKPGNINIIADGALIDCYLQSANILDACKTAQKTIAEKGLELLELTSCMLYIENLYDTADSGKDIIESNINKLKTGDTPQLIIKPFVND